MVDKSRQKMVHVYFTSTPQKLKGDVVVESRQIVNKVDVVPGRTSTFDYVTTT